jgi:hypothetical protein
MPIIVKAPPPPPLHPAGKFKAVCVDVLAPFKTESKYGEQTVTVFVFETDQKTEAGSPSLVRSGLFNVNGLAPKGKLRAFLSAWRGVEITAEEAAQGLDLESFLGMSAEVTVVHEERGGQTYANVDSISSTQNTFPVPGGYGVRKVDCPESPHSTEAAKPDRLELAQKKSASTPARKRRK